MVYAWLRAVRTEGGAVLDETAFQCFPTMHGSDDPAYAVLRKRGVRRVLDAIVWMRAAGVVIRAVPGVSDGEGGHEPTRYLVG
jgi:hypothetical protein